MNRLNSNLWPGSWDYDNSLENKKKIRKYNSQNNLMLKDKIKIKIKIGLLNCEIKKKAKKIYIKYYYN